MNRSAARGRFLGALGLYLAWVGILAAMAITSSYRPPERALRSAPAELPAGESANP